MSGGKTERSRKGYERETTVYSSTECKGRPYKKECIKGNHSNKPLEERNKTLYVSKKFQQYRSEDLERITGREGRELRMNRSIQAEGSAWESAP
ncbi:MAG: transposase [Eubacteriales bacterium]|nr:transposase [Eubacteriales bacterium]